MQQEAPRIPDAMGRGSRAAQYLRMSSDHQKYSTVNQAEVIAAYAARKGLNIVRSYLDEGRSGLNIDRRKGLQALIRDVRNGGADFGTILVYDVSRWGRFQDADESAYYEFICREAGIQVLYCAELFENDGSLPSTLLKAVRRAMAGEQVRDISTKVFIGQSRIAKMGFWRGGFPGYGLRRQLIDENGAIKGLLEFGQRKSLQTDRVVVVHGPAIEVETVKRIFGSFVTEQKGESQIAAELNAEQIRTMLGNRWEPESVTKLLTNEKYLGHIIFNRTSAKLRGKHRPNPPDMWIRRDNAFPALIAPELFKEAQEIIHRRRQGQSESEMIARLAALRSEKGYLTAGMIDADRNAPSTETLRRHYGSLMNAYKLIDYQPSRLAKRIDIAATRLSLLEAAAVDIVTKIKMFGGEASRTTDVGLISIEGEFSLSVCAARASRERLGRMRWYAHVDRFAKSDLTLVLRIDVADTKVEACYLLPTAELARARRNRLSITHPIFVEACRFESVEAFCRMCVGLEEGAVA